MINKIKLILLVFVLTIVGLFASYNIYKYFFYKENNSSTIIKLSEDILDNEEIIMGDSSRPCCSSCGNNTFCLSMCVVCKTCDAGKYLRNGSCYTCAAGSYSGYGATSCNKCPDGSVSSAGSASCTKCKAGTYSNANKTTCVKCKSGTYSKAESTSCTPCDPGQVSPEGASMCVTCPGGTRPASDKSKCIDCEAGTYSKTKSETCTKCEAGTYSGKGAVKCTTCAAGYVSSEGSSSCHTCRAGTMATFNHKECRICAAGAFSPAGSSYCSNCPAGKYSSSAGSATCTTCPAGTYSTGGSTSCTKCKAGTYSPAGSSNCYKCPDNSYSREGSGSCTKCADNQTTDGTTGCTKKPCGEYAYADSCRSAGCYWNYEGSGYCVNQPRYCPENQYSYNGQCRNCPEGTHQSAGNHINCLMDNMFCKKGEFQIVRSRTDMECKPCNGGALVKIPTSISPGQSQIEVKTATSDTWSFAECGVLTISPTGDVVDPRDRVRNITLTGKACSTIKVTVSWNGGSISKEVNVREKWTLVKGVETSSLIIYANRTIADMNGGDFYGKHNCDKNNPSVCDVYTRTCGSVPTVVKPPENPKYNYCCVDNGLPALSSDVKYYKDQTSKSCPSGYSLLEIKESECVKPNTVPGSCKSSPIVATAKNETANTCEGNVSIQINDGQRCTNTNSDKVENSFYKIDCTKKINSKFDYGNDNSTSTKREIRKGNGINFIINVDTVYNCKYEFYDSIWNNTYNNVIDRINQIDKKLVTYVENNDSSGFEKYITNNLSKVGVKNTSRLYELWNIIKSLKDIVKDYTSYRTGNVYKEGAIVTIKTKEKGVSLEKKYNFIQSVNSVGKETKKVLKTYTLTNGTKVENFTLNNEGSPRKVILLPKKACIDKSTNAVIELTDNGTCPKNTIDGGNKMYIGYDTDITEDNKPYPIYISLTGLGSNNSTITNNKCDVLVKDEEYIYRPIDINNPFINDEWNKGENWVNNLYDFSNVINSNTWNESPDKKIELSASDIAAIKESNSRNRASYPYLGLCDKIATTSQDSITQKICRAIQ